MNTTGYEQGQRFRFRLGDVICPDRQEAISQITPELEVSGKIVFLSDCGQQTEQFGVLEVKGMHSPLIVPLDRLRPSADQSDGEHRLAPRQMAGRRE